MRDSYVLIKNGEAFLIGTLITPLISASTHIHPDQQRTRKLLLKRNELDKLVGAVERQGYTVVPIAMYWKNNLVKVEIGLARGKQSHDKRANIKDREWKIEKQQQTETECDDHRKPDSKRRLPTTALLFLIAIVTLVALVHGHRCREVERLNTERHGFNQRNSTTHDRKTKEPDPLRYRNVRSLLDGERTVGLSNCGHHLLGTADHHALYNGLAADIRLLAGGIVLHTYLASCMEAPGRA